jgi:hypothetical protein
MRQLAMPASPLQACPVNGMSGITCHTEIQVYIHSLFKLNAFNDIYEHQLPKKAYKVIYQSKNHNNKK